MPVAVLHPKGVVRDLLDRKQRGKIPCLILVYHGIFFPVAGHHRHPLRLRHKTAHKHPVLYHARS